MDKKKSRNKIRAVIFDLDDTLYDCTGQVVLRAIDDSVRAMKKAGLPFNAKEFSSEIRKRKGRDTFRAALGKTFRLRKYRTADAERLMRIANRRYYMMADVSHIRLFPGAETLLKSLRKSGVKLALVSTGTMKQQMKKIRNLGIRRYFDVILINDVFSSRSKEHHLRKVMERLGLRPRDILVVGNKPNSEIMAGNRLGMKTVQVTAVCDYRPKSDMEKPNCKIRKLSDLYGVLQRQG